MGSWHDPHVKAAKKRQEQIKRDEARYGVSQNRYTAAHSAHDGAGVYGPAGRVTVISNGQTTEERNDPGVIARDLKQSRRRLGWDD